MKIEYHSLETATREQETFKKQQVAALAAGKQDKMWHFIETFYHEQGEEDSGYVTEKYIQGIAQQVPGLNLAQWTADRSDASLVAQVSSGRAGGQQRGLHGHAFVPDRARPAARATKLEYSSLTDPTASTKRSKSSSRLSNGDELARAAGTTMIVLSAIGSAWPDTSPSSTTRASRRCARPTAPCRRCRNRSTPVPGIPVALIGLLGYIAILGSLLGAREREHALADGGADSGFGFSMYLTYRELFTLHKSASGA